MRVTTVMSAQEGALSRLGRFGSRALTYPKSYAATNGSWVAHHFRL